MAVALVTWVFWKILRTAPGMGDYGWATEE